jgi:arylmalonate decarboxylase
MNITKIGLIIPPADGTTPSECRQLYPQLQFVTVGLGVKEMSSTGFAAVADRVLECARSLRTAGVSVVSVMGTSLTFYRGREYNDDLSSRVADEIQLPVTTMSTSIIKALKTNGISRVAVATAYTADLNLGLAQFLEDHGIRIAGIVGLGLTSIDSVRPTSAGIVQKAAEEAFRRDPTADGMLISCGGLPTVQLHVPLEAELEVPVISSLAACLWDVVHLAGVDPRRDGFGRMFAAAPTLAA